MSQFTGLLSAKGLGSMGVVTPVDVTPNAVNWTDILQSSQTIQITNGQQITGISNTITLKLNVNTDNLYILAYNIRAAESPAPGYDSLDWVYLTYNGSPAYGGDTNTFTVSNGDWLWFLFNFDYNNTCVTSTVSVINVSDGNAVLDTFQTQMRPRGSFCP